MGGHVLKKPPVFLRTLKFHPRASSGSDIFARMGSLRPRGHPRVETRLPVEVRGITRPGVLSGRLFDLSLGGAALELERPLRLGEEIAISLRDDQPLPPESEPKEELASTTRIKTPLEVRGEVVWVAWAELGFVRAGIRFLTDEVSLEIFLRRAIAAIPASDHASTG